MDYDLTIDEEYLEKLAEPYKVPAICLIMVDEDDPEALPGCWIGGQPRMPDHIEWPHCKADYTDDPVPMYFIAQLDMAQIPRVEGFEHMPEKGNLLFFHLPNMTDYQTEVIYIEEDLNNLSKTGRPYTPADFKENYGFFLDEGEVELKFSNFKTVNVLTYFVPEDFFHDDEKIFRRYCLEKNRVLYSNIIESFKLNKSYDLHGMFGSFRNYSFFPDDNPSDITKLLHLGSGQSLGLTQAIQIMIQTNKIKNNEYDNVYVAWGEGLL